MLAAQCNPEVFARQHMDACYELLKKRRRGAVPDSHSPASASRKTLGSWHSLPEPFKRLLARNARLPEAVTSKRDRDLSEPEKAALRAAAGRLHALSGSVLEL